jgi:hypothetical protein
MWLDELRSDLSNLILTNTFKENWNLHWCEELKIILTGDIIDLELLSEQIRELFLSASSGSRAPEQAGLQWRRFLWCVLSILSTNDNELVLLGRPMINKIMPSFAIQHLSISIGEDAGLTHNPEFILINFNNELAMNQSVNTENIKNLLETNPKLIKDITVIWAKTNFNDTIQQPMLWAKIGMLNNEKSEFDVKHAWVTVPSNKPEKFRPNTTPFNRANVFDGGSYWGLGKRDEFEMKSIFDIVSNWKQRIEQLQSQKTVEKSLLYDSLGLK